MKEQEIAQKSFLGVPIHGDIDKVNPRAAQKPLEELAPLFQAILDDPLIAEFGWNQYTPYFNDGDPCEFSVHDPWFRTTQDEENQYKDAYEVGSWTAHPTLGRIVIEYQGVYPDRRDVEVDVESDHEATLRACLALKNAFGSGAFEDVLQTAFGDHAEIVVRRDGIDVETYEHD